MSPGVRHKPGLAPGAGDCLSCKARRHCLSCKARRHWLTLCYIAGVVTVILVLMIRVEFR